MTSRGGWHDRTDPATVARRAGGRRAFNAWRRLKAEVRRRELSRLIVELDAAGGSFLLTHGAQAGFARRLGVHRSTVARDIRRLFRRELYVETLAAGFARLGLWLDGWGRVYELRKHDDLLAWLDRRIEERIAELGGDEARPEVLDRDRKLANLNRQLDRRRREVALRLTREKL